jgi:hypothetical protein
LDSCRDLWFWKSDMVMLPLAGQRNRCVSPHPRRVVVGD